MREIDKAYYIREKELAVLLSMAGQKEIYGYPLHGVSGIDEADIHQMLFDMAGRGMLDAKDGKISIAAEWQGIVDGIVGASTLIVSASAVEEKEQLFIYVSDKAVAIRAQWHGSDMVRAEIWQNVDVPEQVVRHGIRPDSVLRDMAQAKIKKVLSDIDTVQKKADELFSRPLTEILREKNVWAVAACHDVKRQKKDEQMIVFSHRLENYISVSSEGKSTAGPYSDGKASDIIGKWVGG